MWGLRAPLLIDALLQRFTAWPELGAAAVPVAVRDGPMVTDEAVQEVLLVGWTGIEGETAADSTMTPEGLSDPNRELCSIRCSAVVIDGGTDTAGPRRRAYQLVAAAGAAIASDPTLGRLAMRALITSVSLVPTQTTQGAQAVVNFTVDCDCFNAR